MRPFWERHIGPRQADIQHMLEKLSLNSLDELVQKSAPPSILEDFPAEASWPAMSEADFLKKARELAQENKLYSTFIGQGYYGTYTPSVIQRNILENPAWYTAYTPYQAEISQGRMEALLNFQTMTLELTGMEIANASLLDEATAAAEAMTFCQRANKKNKSHKILIDPDIFIQTKEVLQTRARPLGIEIIEASPDSFDWSKDQPFAVFVQYPSARGKVSIPSWIQKAHEHQALVACIADPLALCLLQPPGEWGADVVVGSTQRFGVPMGFGGPHAAYFATKDVYKRLVPGRIIGVSKDSLGQPALRLALQTREQHIRREKATSNICTAQVLLAVISSMYAVYHGPEGLKQIAQSVHQKASQLAEALQQEGFSLFSDTFFDTVSVYLTAEEAQKLIDKGLEKSMNIGFYHGDVLSISISETTSSEELKQLIKLFYEFKNSSKEVSLPSPSSKLPPAVLRSTPPLQHPVFKKYHSETEFLRYVYHLEKKDLSLTHSMIPLGSCTMKLNATTEMLPITWPEFNQLHPFAPLDQAQGLLKIIKDLEQKLASLTGFAATSLQPNAGSQGEYTGLLVIRKYLESKGEQHRHVCLIPASAHGTNPASAALAGFQIQVVACDSQGNIDVQDLKNKAQENAEHLAALMITYPSTHGVFEQDIIEICNIIHEYGGQVYLDGANLNALVGISLPGQWGPDVAHLNLHKTFCIPHGGGGPGVGPIVVREHLKDFLPSHPVHPECGPKDGISAVAAAPWGSASILPISWAYLLLMGTEGLKKATQVAILNANYIAHRLKPYAPVLYHNKEGWVAHECILDMRPLKDQYNVTVDDVAKRLMDYGFHAPTMSWPVPGTLMIEPTESESLEELDRFCEAMIAIIKEAEEIGTGKADKENNVLKKAPHSFQELTSSHWEHPYSREKAGFPLPWVYKNKFWLPVGRVDNAYGDRHLFCSCPPLIEEESNQ